MCDAAFVPRRALLRPIPVLVLVCALVVGATVIATVRYGMGLTPDSLVYLDGARSLADGHGYESAGSAITNFAPGYSAVLSIAHRAGLDAADGARLLASLTFAATVALGFVLLRRHVRSPRVLVAGTVAIGCSAVLLHVYEEALSEHLFVVVTLLFVLAAEDATRSPERTAPWVEVVALTWAAFYLRYAGIVFVPISVVIALIALRPLGWARTVGQSAVLAAAGVAVPAVWMKRNVDAGAGLLGVRQDSASSLFTNVSRTAYELSTWVATDWIPYALRVVLMIGLVVAAGIAITQWKVRLPRAAREMVPLAVVITVYLAYLMISASLVAFAAINTRFMSPVFVPTVVVAAWGFEQARPQVTPKIRRVLTIGAAVWLSAAVLAFGVDLVQSARNGAGGYATARWHNSKLMQDVRRLDASTPIYSNDAGVIGLFTGRSATLSVAKTFFASNEQTGNLPAFLRRVECAGHVTLVWFLPNARPRLYSPSELDDHLHLAVSVSRPDGVIYDVTPLATAQPSSRSTCR